ncbi:MAG TPA: hypothetical protein VF895_08895 [Gaiellaceae bacterium]
MALLVVISTGISPGVAGAAHPRGANVAVNLIGPDLIVGGRASYRLLVTNTGSRKATEVTAFLSLPPGVELAPSANQLCRATSAGARCSLGGLSPGHYKNTPLTLSATNDVIGHVMVSVLARQLDPDLSNNLIVLPMMAQAGPALADIAVAMGPGDHYGLPMGQVTITNRGPGPAIRVLVDYRLPLGATIKGGSTTTSTNCSTELRDDNPMYTMSSSTEFQFCIARIEPNESEKFLIGLVLPDSASWSAVATPATPDPDLSNNTAQGTVG